MPPGRDKLFELWVYSMLIALGQLSGGSLTQAPENASEYILFFFALLIGSCTWAIVQVRHAVSRGFTRCRAKYTRCSGT